jgi:hypothetical protein
MVGLSDAFWVYQNSGPALLVLIVLGGGYVWRHDIQPRLADLEQTQEQRGDRWEDHRLDARERTLLIDDAQERVDQVEDAVQRLQDRLRDIEQAYARDRGEAVPDRFTNLEDFARGGGDGGDPADD